MAGSEMPNSGNGQHDNISNKVLSQKLSQAKTHWDEVDEEPLKHATNLYGPQLDPPSKQQIPKAL